MKQYLLNVLRMAAWGVPGILLAFLLNYLLYQVLVMNIYLAYAIVITVVSFVNFFVINNIVFKGEKSKSSTYRIGNYTIIVIASKLGEWLLYSSLIYLFDIYFLLAQLLVSMVFLFIKYSSFKLVMK